VSSKLDEKLEAFFEKFRQPTSNDKDKNDQGVVKMRCNKVSTTLLTTCKVMRNVRPMTMEIVTYMSKFISCSLQTGANVPDKLKNQIWARKYIYFHLL
jgi:hypothetical protein